jgi:hypothetical protein
VPKKKLTVLLHLASEWEEVRNMARSIKAVVAVASWKGEAV